MTRPTRVEINCETGVETVIEYTDEEIAQMEIEAKEAEAKHLERIQKEQELIALKSSAKAKLVAGEPLTEEEASVLVI